MKATNKQG